MIYNLKAYRLAYGFTQLQMAEMLGLSKSAVSMIETGRRPLPEGANRLLIQLQNKSGENNGQHLQAAHEEFFHDLTSQHRETSGDYITIYCGDLKAEMHRLNKQIQAWTQKFNEAGRVLMKVQFMLFNMRRANSLSTYTYDNYMVEKMAAEKQLKEVFKQKPELAMIRIEGIKKELEAAQKLLGKRHRFPVLDEVTNYYVFKNKPELPSPDPDNPLLPEGDQQS
ncbi:helix-turn-helix transcriptional regulator [Ferruginibacter sp. HRS2-29]|uniref:helix-turn-helix transcriptional regulator n=1 Tax=Ferruginibacter sp. HRS2-29 TaxID=2487334 RepID=UPI0020CF7C7D|nr:helix-turn-helix transcriptional regulator [Ferruginibacter sp. HRS2-29]